MAMTDPYTLEPVHLESTASIIARRLRRAIMYGSLPPGSQLTETGLAAQLRVSRGPLREAMQRLVQEGLLRSERNRGLFVITLTPDDVRDVYTARAAIERTAVMLILRQNPERAVARLTEVHRKMQDAAARADYHTLSDSDLEFHEVLVTESGSPRLMRMHGTLLVETRMCMTALESTYQRPDEVVEEHGELVKALRGGEEARLLRLIDAHMEDALRRLAHHAQEAHELEPSLQPPRRRSRRPSRRSTTT
jgi:DNA-binding GntR family transcriptional regulator